MSEQDNIHHPIDKIIYGETIFSMYYNNPRKRISIGGRACTSLKAFLTMPKNEILSLGAKLFEYEYVDNHYIPTGTIDSESDGVVIRSEIPKNKYTIGELKNKFNNDLKNLGKQLILTAKEWIEYYTEFPEAGKLTEWQTYISDLKNAYGIIKSEVHPTITKYNNLVAYIKCEPDPKINGWRKYIPEQPE